MILIPSSVSSHGLYTHLSISWFLVIARMYHLCGGEGGICYHVEHLRAAKEEMWQDMNDWKRMPEMTAEALERGLPELAEIAVLSRRRDEALVKVIQALKAAESSPSSSSE